ncbi:Coenzyme F420 hydrogenase/dehydrogenase, beta subunit N-term [Pseudobutyrivibrio sp. 49]|uniref:Coenzyme F420 hydrogenase/dehydrogenase, beta subunit C-terminal domain n=1 Tax=Pseudobutyrivibrio sp. 49 TaxID=1855344 RepID=UPI00089044CF|nr:Coenzyme F420 hydrogenase/dehydrogenase, beta subunit C-terminal domain [Pseudobutyrivibrio sp. 49]SDI72248.1 Coenzyme F420 hydrogenase/dehydrogenase, beta subunit N-term [Pseudobutyrivibrio sp. 49]
MKDKVVLFETEDKCSGCGVCMNACPKGAISLKEDERGFVFPQIDSDICIGCGACKKVCGYNNIPELNSVKKSYAVSNKNTDSIRKSASGGAFYILAKKIIEQGGYVYGASMEKEDDALTAKHIEISSVNQLNKLQGSKYVQSDVGYIYKEVKKRAINGDSVLFSGTPCQVAGLKNYLGKEYSNVILVEIICHGVPNSRLFKDFIRYNQRKNNCVIGNFFFRDKTHGQGYTTKTVFTKNNKQQVKIGKGELTAYIRFFSKSLILRDSCYSCPFAQGSRVADFTIGDYWGFAKEHNDQNMNEKNGISCVLCNNEKAIDFLDECKNDFNIIESEYSKIAKHNKQLNGPTEKSSDRDMVLETYVKSGYSSLEKLYWRKYPKDKVKYIISAIIPADFKRNVRRIFR